MKECRHCRTMMNDAAPYCDACGCFFPPRAKKQSRHAASDILSWAGFSIAILTLLGTF